MGLQTTNRAKTIVAKIPGSLSAQRGSIAVVQFLLDHGAVLKAKNKRGRTALDEAIGDEGLNGERRQARPEVAALLTKLMNAR